MKKLTALVVLMLLLRLSLEAQVSVRFIVKDQSGIRHDSIYITGTFSNWDSTFNPYYKMRSLGASTKEIVLRLKPGRIEYKFHRGNWKTVEKTFEGYEVKNRVANLTRDTTILDCVVAWRDQLFLGKWLALANSPTDTAKVQLYGELARIYAFANAEYENIDSALYYSRQALLLLQDIKKEQFKSPDRYFYYLFDVQELTAQLMHSLGNYSKSLELKMSNLEIAERLNDDLLISSSIQPIIDDYAAMKDYASELKYCDLLIGVTEKAKFPDPNQLVFKLLIAFGGKAEVYYHMGRLDSSLYYANQTYQIAEKHDWIVGQARSRQLLGDIYLAMNNFPAASSQYTSGVDFAIKEYDFPGLARLYDGLARLNKRTGNLDSALHYAKASFNILRDNKANIQSWGENMETTEADISPLLAELYHENHQPDSAYKYLRLSVDLKDSLYNVNRLRQFQNISFNETMRRLQQTQEEKFAQQQFSNKIKIYGLLAGILVTLIVMILMYRNSKQKQEANILLLRKNKEVDEQRAKAEKALNELKTTQSQLVHAEKMASLGELTAGIAHEIQNPLNFVNNFSEVSAELLDDIKTELDKGDVVEAKAIVEDVKQNLQKIAYHGKRADGIVKSMLQHSRKGSGQKDLVDINALVDEYLRMSYHGYRAKDKSFNAILETHFDPGVKAVRLIGQDIGRVLLNLFNNAFYAVNERKKSEQNGFEPMVQVTTARLNGGIEIKVKDNGTGIPEKVLEKIYQPFFTTKPTGEGTGLGLSLSYDIITKGHGGDMKVKTAEGEGSEFIIQLPNSSSL